MRFVAPARDAVAAAVFGMPVFDAIGEYRHFLLSDWPSPAELDAALAPAIARATGRAITFVDASALAGDGLHYEQRILESNRVATRRENWHDLFNALIWRRFPATKSALNRRQCEDLAACGPHRRTPAQQAMTHYDEAGAVVLLRDASLLDAWDRHDWTTLFLDRADAWRSGAIEVSVFGHALLEHALLPELYPVAKALVFFDPASVGSDFDPDRRVAAAIAARDCLNDPQELRPLPLSGIPGWHRDLQDAAFYRERPCFRPLRAGRRYPPPLPAQDRGAVSR